MSNFFQVFSVTCLKIILVWIYEEKELKKGSSWGLDPLYLYLHTTCLPINLDLVL